MFAKIENNIVTEYPLSDQDIRMLFPNISFPPGNITPPAPYVRVWPNVPPVVNQNQDCIEIAPKFENGIWKQDWQVINITTEEEQAKIEAAQNAKLAELAEKRWVASQQPILHNGYLFKMDFESQMLYAKYADMNASLTWKVANGVFVFLEASDFIALKEKSIGQIQSLFNTEKVWSDKIKSYTDIETINSINVDVF